VVVEQRKQPKLDLEMKNLRAQLAYTSKKFEAESGKLKELSTKR